MARARSRRPIRGSCSCSARPSTARKRRVQRTRRRASSAATRSTIRVRTSHPGRTPRKASPKPTSVSMPAAVVRKSSPPAKRKDPTPPPAVLAIGDKSGTVEVDPVREGLEVEDDLDFDDLAAPPVAPRRGSGSREAWREERDLEREEPGREEDRCKPQEPDAGAPHADPRPGSRRRQRSARDSRRRRGTLAAARARSATPSRSRRDRSTSTTRCSRSRAPSRAACRHRRARTTHRSASRRRCRASALQLEGRTIPAPHGPPMPPAAPLPPAPRVPLAAALPTLAALPPPQHAADAAADAAPERDDGSAATAAIRLAAAARERAAQDARDSAPPPPLGHRSAPSRDAAAAVMRGTTRWPRHTSRRCGRASRSHLAPPNADGRPRSAAAMPMPMEGRANRPNRHAAALEAVDRAVGGRRRRRDRRRRVRRVSDPRGAAAKADSRARASTRTISRRPIRGGLDVGRRQPRRHRRKRRRRSRTARRSRAREALMRTSSARRSADAKTAVDELAARAGLDGEIATAYLALAQSDARPRRWPPTPRCRSAERCSRDLRRSGRRRGSPAIRGRGQARCSDALEKDPRPLYARRARPRARRAQRVGRRDRERSTARSRPAPTIRCRDRARVGARRRAARSAPGSAVGNETRAQLDKVLADGAKPPRIRSSACRRLRSRSPSSRWRGSTSRAAMATRRVAISTPRPRVGLDGSAVRRGRGRDVVRDRRARSARSACRVRASSTWPASRRARIVLAEIALAQGPADRGARRAVEASRCRSSAARRRGARRGELAAGDSTARSADFDAALKKQPNLEPAIVGRAWLDAARGGDVDGGAQADRAALRRRQGARRRSTTVYAAISAPGDDAATARPRRCSKVVDGAAGGAAPLPSSSSRASIATAANSRGARAVQRAPARPATLEARLEPAPSMAIEIAIRPAAATRSTRCSRTAATTPAEPRARDRARAHARRRSQRRGAAARDRGQARRASRSGSSQRETRPACLRKGDFAAAATALATRSTAAATIPRRSCSPPTPRPTTTSPALGDKLKKAARRIGSRAARSRRSSTGKLLLQAGGKDGEAEAAYRARARALDAEHAPARAIAQADFGLAVVAYNKAARSGRARRARPRARAAIRRSTTRTCSRPICAKDKKAAFELAQKAVKLQPRLSARVERARQARGEGQQQGDARDGDRKLGALAPNSRPISRSSGDEASSTRYCIANTTATAAPAASTSITMIDQRPRQPALVRLAVNAGAIRLEHLLERLDFAIARRVGGTARAA